MSAAEMTPVVADSEAAKRIEIRQKANSFVGKKVELVTKERLYESPERLFTWARGVYDEVKFIDPSFSSIFLSVVIFDKVDSLEAGEKWLKKAVSYSGGMGILPWDNFVGLRLQASSCLAEFIEKALIQA